MLPCVAVAVRPPERHGLRRRSPHRQVHPSFVPGVDERRRGAPHARRGVRHLVVARLEREERRAVIGSAERPRIVEVDGAVFSRRHHQLPVREREGERAARREVEILRVDLVEVRRREVVEHLAAFSARGAAASAPTVPWRDPSRRRPSARRTNRRPKPFPRVSMRRSGRAVLVKKRETGCAGFSDRSQSCAPPPGRRRAAAAAARRFSPARHRPPPRASALAAGALSPLPPERGAPAPGRPLPHPRPTVV